MTSRKTALGNAVRLLVALGIIVPALSGADLAAARLPDLEVTDLWDDPESLRAIVAGGMTLFFICDPDLKECREGAVFIENRASIIREAGVRPVLLLRGSGPDVRNAALEMDLDTPIYIDEDGQVIESMLDQRVLPALLLVSQDGSILETAYGGGESLAGNLDDILPEEKPEPPPPVVAEPEKKSGGKWKYLVGLGIILIAGVLVFAD